MEFLVKVQEEIVKVGYIRVSADDEDEAWDKAEELVTNGEFKLKRTTSVVTVQEVEEIIRSKDRVGNK